MNQAAAGGRQGFANGCPSPEVSRSFRARNRQLTYLIAEM